MSDFRGLDQGTITKEKPPENQGLFHFDQLSLSNFSGGHSKPDVDVEQAVQGLGALGEFGQVALL